MTESYFFERTVPLSFDWYKTPKQHYMFI